MIKNTRVDLFPSRLWGGGGGDKRFDKKNCSFCLFYFPHPFQEQQRMRNKTGKDYIVKLNVKKILETRGFSPKPLRVPPPPTPGYCYVPEDLRTYYKRPASSAWGLPPSPPPPPRELTGSLAHSGLIPPRCGLVIAG